MTRPFTIAGGTDTTPTTLEAAQALVAKLAEEKARSLETAVADLLELAEDMAGADSAQPVGRREIARKLALDLNAASQSLEVIRGRQDRSTK